MFLNRYVSIALLALVALIPFVLAQTNPNFHDNCALGANVNTPCAAGTQPTLNGAFAAKQDYPFPTQAPNVFFSGPSSGGAATPSWRALVGADLPLPFTNGVRSGNTSSFATTSGTLTNTHCVEIDANGNFIDAGAACGVGGGGGGITALTGDVAATGPGSAAATIQSGVVTAGKIASGTILGTNFPNQSANTVFSGPPSGGAASPTWRALQGVDLPTGASGITGANFPNQSANTFFAGPTTGGATSPSWRAMVTADLPTPFKNGTRSGNTTTFATTSGSLINNDCVKFDANGNLVDAGGACGGGSGTVTTSGVMVNGDCVKTLGGTVIADAGAPCGSGGGSGTNLGWINITTYGAVGDGNCHPLSGIYPNLAAAQAVYSFVSDLTQCVDWAATQLAINVAFANSPANASATVYCPAGQYSLSNPIFFDQANNSQGTNPAWAVGTTYGNGQMVTYNGIPWQSMGSGNVGNPPTSQATFPQQTMIAFNSILSQAGFPWTTVTISNGSPAVVTVPGGGITIANNSPVVFFTQQFTNANGGSTPALPAGINPNQVYYAANVTGSTFNISATPSGSLINTSGVGVGTFFVTPQVWQVVPNGTGNQFSNRVSFVGDEGIPSQGGCRFRTNYNYTTPVFFVNTHNGNLIKNISVQSNGPQADGTNTYVGARCTQPFSLVGMPTSSSPAGPSVGNVGWALIANGGGSRTKFENVGAQGFYVGFWIGYGTNGELSDQNTWEKPLITDNCIGIFEAETQAFINTIYDGSGNDNVTHIVAFTQEGVKVIGGTYSTGITNSTAFAVTSVSSTSGCGVLCVTATITSPDNYMNGPMCAYSAGQANAAGAAWLNSWFVASGCGYNTFVMNVPHWGYIGMYVVNYVPSTGVITLGVPTSWTGIYQGACCGSDLTTQIATVTTLYAVEASTEFFGDIQADTVHVENAGAAATLSCFCTKFFGGARPAELRNIVLNSEASNGSNACCNNTGSGTKYHANFYAQNVIPFINSTLGDTVIDQLSGGWNGLSFPTGFSRGVMDRPLIATETSTYVEGRHMMGANNQVTSTGSGGNNASPLFDFASSSIGNAFLSTPPLINPGTLGQLSGGYYKDGGSAYGAGSWDNPANFVSSAAFSVNASNQMVNQADLWRSRGWGQSPYWGVRPAPWSSPCILPSQATSLASLPAITYTANLQDFLNVSGGGTGFTVGDTLTLTGGTGTAATVTVTAISGGGGTGPITAVQIATTGSYTGTLPTTFGETGGTGANNATFSLPIWYTNYTIGYPLLWGGKIYTACNYNNADFGSHTTPVGTSANTLAIKSTHTGWTYGQNLTTTNIGAQLAGGNLWTMDGASPYIYLAPGALELAFPGWVFNLTGAGSCSGTENFIVLEVHATGGYVKVVRADNDGSNYVPALAASGTTCSGATIGQAAFSLVYPY